MALKPSRLLFATASLCSAAFLAGACTIKEGTWDGFGGQGGGGGEAATGGKSSGTGGTASGGSSTGGTGLGGAGGATVTLDCSDDGSVLGSPGAKPDAGDACLSCLYSKCKTSYEGCFATAPATACAEANIVTMFDGSSVPVSGEFSCIWACMQDLAINSSDTYVAAFSDVDRCVPSCGALECDRADAAGVLAKNLGYCMTGVDPNTDPILAGDCITECGIDVLPK